MVRVLDLVSVFVRSYLNDCKLAVKNQSIPKLGPQSVTGIIESIYELSFLQKTNTYTMNIHSLLSLSAIENCISERQYKIMP